MERKTSHKSFSEYVDLLPCQSRTLIISPFWQRKEEIEYCVTDVNLAFVSLRYRRLTFRQFSKRHAK